MTFDATPITAPRRRLLNAPTALQRLRNLETKLGRANLYMKRDDHMEIGLGGNKLRSLEFWLGAAQHVQADILVVAGGAMSNLCRLTAAAASICGLDCIVVHSSADTASSRQMSFLNQVFGAEVRYLGQISEDQRGAAVLRIVDELKARGRKPYVVGDAIVGALGYALAAYEMHEQTKRDGIELRHVFLPGSMGPTEAGFIFGNALLGNPFDVHLVSVEYGQAELAARIARIYDELKAHTRLSVCAADDLPVHYHMDHLGPGYGRPTAEAEEALLLLARTEGILTEYVYTAKTFAGFVDLTTSKRIPSGEAACMIHTGGVPSLFSQFDLFRTIR